VSPSAARPAAGEGPSGRSAGWGHFGGRRGEQWCAVPYSRTTVPGAGGYQCSPEGTRRAGTTHVPGKPVMASANRRRPGSAGRRPISRKDTPITDSAARVPAIRVGVQSHRTRWATPCGIGPTGVLKIPRVQKARLPHPREFTVSRSLPREIKKISHRWLRRHCCFFFRLR